MEEVKLISVSVVHIILFFQSFLFFRLQQKLSKVLFREIHQSKCLNICFLHALAWTRQHQSAQVVDQLKQFGIRRVIIEWQNGYAVGELEAKRVDSVVNEDYVLDEPVPDDSQILHIYAFIRPNAMLSVQPRIFPFGIQQFIDYCVRICLMRRSEYRNFETKFCGLLQAPRGRATCQTC